MDWTTNEESVDVISKEVVEDTDPALYRMRAKALAKQGLYDDADEEYEKSINYAGGWSYLYIGKALFWFGQGRNIRSITALLMSTWKFFYRNIDFILLFVVILQAFDDWGIGTFGSMFIVGIERAVRATRKIEGVDGEKIPIQKYRKNIIYAIIGVGAAIVLTIGFVVIGYYIVACLFIFAYCVMMFALLVINVLAMFFRKIKSII